MPTLSGFSKQIGSAVIPGTVIGEHKLPGNIKPGDTLLAVEQIQEGSPPTRTDRTAEFSITAGKGGSITNTTTNLTGSTLVVIWAKTD